MSTKALESLREIAEQDDFEMVLDPTWAKRIAQHAIAELESLPTVGRVIMGADSRGLVPCHCGGIPHLILVQRWEKPSMEDYWQVGCMHRGESAILVQSSVKQIAIDDWNDLQLPTSDSQAVEDDRLKATEDELINCAVDWVHNEGSVGDLRRAINQALARLKEGR